MQETSCFDRIHDQCIKQKYTWGNRNAGTGWRAGGPDPGAGRGADQVTLILNREADYVITWGNRDAGTGRGHGVHPPDLSANPISTRGQIMLSYDYSPTPVDF